MEGLCRTGYGLTVFAILSPGSTYPQARIRNALHIFYQFPILVLPNLNDNRQAGFSATESNTRGGI